MILHLYNIYHEPHIKFQLNVFAIIPLERLCIVCGIVSFWQTKPSSNNHSMNSLFTIVLHLCVAYHNHFLQSNLPNKSQKKYQSFTFVLRHAAFKCHLSIPCSQPPFLHPHLSLLRLFQSALNFSVLSRKLDFVEFGISACILPLSMYPNVMKNVAAVIITLP